MDPVVTSMKVERREWKAQLLSRLTIKREESNEPPRLNLDSEISAISLQILEDFIKNSFISLLIVDLPNESESNIN